MKKFPTSQLRPKQLELQNLKDNAINHLNISLNGNSHEKLKRKFNKFPGFPYEQSLLKTLYEGSPKFDRTGTDTIGIHGHQSRFNLDYGFPLITTKKVHLKSVIHELLWLVRGETNIKYLVEKGVSIWSDWPLKYYNQQKSHHASMSGTDSLAYEELSLNEFHEKIIHEPGFAEKCGELGPVYGQQWRGWSAQKKIPTNPVGTNDFDTVIIPEHIEEYTIDQLQQVVDSINKQHTTGVISRRMLVTAWNPADLEEMSKAGLPPCHCLFQFHSRLMTLNERRNNYQEMNDLDWAVVAIMNDDDLDCENAPVYELDLQLYQRSCDIFLGVPFNITSYALLLMMVAQVTNCKPGTFIHDYGDLHIYSNHLDQVIEQLSRNPRPYPTMKLNNRGQKIDEFEFNDFMLEGYNPHPAIKAPVAV